MWTRLQLVFAHAQCPNTKFFMLVLTESSIKAHWAGLAPGDRELLRNYLLQLFLELSARSKADDPLLSKLSSIIVEIGRRDWDGAWPDFLPQICTASASDINICYQGLKILRYLSE